MQNRYAGDIGDYVKLAILRHLAVGKRLGVAWWLFPDETNNDGGHVTYLSNAEKWKHLDPELFEGLPAVVKSKNSIRARASKVSAAGYILFGRRDSVLQRALSLPTCEARRVVSESENGP